LQHKLELSNQTLAVRNRHPCLWRLDNASWLTIGVSRACSNQLVIPDFAALFASAERWAAAHLGL